MPESPDESPRESHSHNFINIPAGSRFGRLTVVRFDKLKRYPNGSRSACWLVRCECGKEISIPGQDLRRGHSTQCVDCQRTIRRYNLAGMMTGKLTVLGYAGEKRWNCRCACGTVVPVSTSRLLDKRKRGILACPACTATMKDTAREERRRQSEARRQAKKQARRDYIAHLPRATAVCLLASCGKEFIYIQFPGGCERQHCCTRHGKRHIYSIKTGLKRAKALGVKIVGRPDPQNVLRRDRFNCQICHRHLNKRDCGTQRKYAPEVDHRVAFVNGGEHSEENMQTVCHTCHEAKSLAEVPLSAVVDTKLTWDIAEKIRDAYATGIAEGKKMSHRILAMQYGVSRKHVGAIIRREVWTRPEAVAAA